MIFVDGLIEEIESKVSSLSSLKLNGLIFVDDFVGLSDSKQGLLNMIYHMIYGMLLMYSKNWHFEVNVAKMCCCSFQE